MGHTTHTCNIRWNCTLTQLFFILSYYELYFKERGNLQENRSFGNETFYVELYYIPKTANSLEQLVVTGRGELRKKWSVHVGKEPIHA
jgi:hypothetical protein